MIGWTKSLQLGVYSLATGWPINYLKCLKSLKATSPIILLTHPKNKNKWIFVYETNQEHACRLPLSFAYLNAGLSAKCRCVPVKVLLTATSISFSVVLLCSRPNANLVTKFHASYAALLRSNIKIPLSRCPSTANFTIPQQCISSNVNN